MRNDHIPDEEIMRDINDTRAEIHMLKQRESALGVERSAVLRGIVEREEFIAKLFAILANRENEVRP